jgi:hypothetical protein
LRPDPAIRRTAFDFQPSYSLEPLPRQLLRPFASYAFTATSYAVTVIVIAAGDGIGSWRVAVGEKAP